LRPTLALALALACATPASASWLSDVTGINIDLMTSPVSPQSPPAVAAAIEQRVAEVLPNQVAIQQPATPDLLQRVYSALLDLNLQFAVETVGETTFIDCDFVEFERFEASEPNLLGRTKLVVQVSSGSAHAPLLIRFNLEEKRRKSPAWRASRHQALDSRARQLVERIRLSVAS
jgi:hypothetical protein